MGDEFGLQRKRILSEMLSEFEEEDLNHEIEKRDADPGFKVKSHKSGGHKFGLFKFGGHKTKSHPKKHRAPVHLKVHGHKFLKQSKKHHGKRDAEEEDEAVT